MDLEKNWLVNWLKRHMRITPKLHGEHFFVREPDPKTGKVVLWATPLFLTLCMIEIADLVFAVDSVPAIFAITTDTFIVYTSNIFAILGLRAMYFALSALIHRFHYLKYALALVLVCRRNEDLPGQSGGQDSTGGQPDGDLHTDCRRHRGVPVEDPKRSRDPDHTHSGAASARPVAAEVRPAEPAGVLTFRAGGRRAG